MNYLPLISVLVPNYNHSQFLKPRLKSIFNQSYKNIEVILLDDKSTHNSLEILSTYELNKSVAYIVF
jgi:glycosyltransferase involved in cell wall biosynthesis